jgi:hypothetical protein
MRSDNAAVVLATVLGRSEGVLGGRAAATPWRLPAVLVAHAWPRHTLTLKP